MSTTAHPESLEAIVAAVDAQPTLAKLLGAARKIDARKDALLSVRFAVLRNYTVEPGFPATLAIESARRGLGASLYLGDFDNVQSDVFDAQSALYASEPDVCVLALRLHVLAPKLAIEFAGLDADEKQRLVAAVTERMRGFVAALRERTRAIVLVHAFELPLRAAFGAIDAVRADGQQATIAGLNAALAQICREHGAYLVDINAEIAALGYERALDDRYWHIARAPYTLALQTRLARTYVAFAAALKGKNKKCLVLDCDNTLWGGVIGEDGIAGIKLGATSPGSAFVEFQAAILDLYHRGILLALNSKNNEADAMEVFATHPQSLLKPEHFVAKRINWTDKATNLREIAAELNIGIDSLVFIDDNPVECRLVRERLPDVETIELPRDPSRFARLLRDLTLFETLTLSDEDRRRSEMYRAESARTKLAASSGSMAEFLASLEMTLKIRRGDAFTIPRIAQLTQKTNQFNLTTRRYAEADIAAMLADDACDVLSVELSDMFDNAGIIAVALTRDEGDDVVIDTYLMSCRVIGRGVEEALLAKLAASARARGRKRLVGEYLPTAKNELVREFYERLGFIERPGSDRRFWTLDLQAADPQAPTWFATILDEAP
jgi:FkbH-like protein